MRITRHVGLLLISSSFASLTLGADDSRLVEAVKRQDKQAVRALLGEKVDVKTPQPDGATALHWAVHWEDADLVNQLIRAGSDVNAANDNGVTPLELACANGNSAILDALLKAGANPSVPFSPGETALMTVARTGNLRAVGVFLDRGVDINAFERSRGQTALMWAAAEGHVDVVRELIKRGANVGAKSKAGFTPLLFATRTGDLNLVKLLLGAGAQVNEAATDGTTPLLIATIRSDITLIRFFLDQGADSNRGAGFTPLHWAVGDWAGRDTDAGPPPDANEWLALEGLKGAPKQELVKLLMAHGADVNARADGSPPRFGAGRARGGSLAGATPFLFAAKAGDVAVMRLLLAAGADPRATTKSGATALMLAAGLVKTNTSERDALDAIKLCVELGADVNAGDEAGETALHSAAYRGNDGALSIVRFLVEKGARVNAKDMFGWTPLAIAEGVYNGVNDTRNDPTADLLRQLGAEPSPPDVERDTNIAALKAQRGRPVR